MSVITKFSYHGEPGHISRLKDGDENAFGLIFENWYEPLYSFAYRYLKETELAEDIVQDTMIQLWANRTKLDVNVSLGPYIFTIAKRLCLNALRQLSMRKNAAEHIYHSMNLCINSTQDNVFLKDLERITQEAIALMPAKQQLVYKMSRNQGMSLDEISKSLGMMKNTVKKHLSEALKAIRKYHSLKYCLNFIAFLALMKK